MNRYIVRNTIFGKQKKSGLVIDIDVNEIENVIK